jgi:hypothetical protein
VASLESSLLAAQVLLLVQRLQICDSELAPLEVAKEVRSDGALASDRA